MRRSFSTASAASRSRTRSARNACTRSRCSEPASPPPRSDSRAAGRLDRLDPEDRVGACGSGTLALLRGVGEGRIHRRTLRRLDAAVARGPSSPIRPRRSARSRAPTPPGPASTAGACARQQPWSRPSPGPARPRAAALRRRGGRPSARPRPSPRLSAGASARQRGTTSPGPPAPRRRRTRRGVRTHPRGRPSPPCGTTPHRLRPRTPAGRSGSRRGSSRGRRRPPARRACRARPVPARVPCTTACRAPSPAATPSPPIRCARSRRRMRRRWQGSPSPRRPRHPGRAPWPDPSP